MNAQYIAKSTVIQALNHGAITLLQSVLDRGKRDKVFRQDVDPVDVHLLISSFCFFRVSNRYTFNALFGRNLSDPAVCVLHNKMLIDATFNAVMANSATEPDGWIRRSVMCGTRRCLGRCDKPEWFPQLCEVARSRWSISGFLPSSIRRLHRAFYEDMPEAMPRIEIPAPG